MRHWRPGGACRGGADRSGAGRWWNRFVAIARRRAPKPLLPDELPAARRAIALAAGLAMTSAVRIRPGDDADADQLIALIGACWAQYPGIRMDVDGEMPELRALATYYATSGGALWVAEDGGCGDRHGGDTAACAEPPGMAKHSAWRPGKQRRNPGVGSLPRLCAPLPTWLRPRASFARCRRSPRRRGRVRHGSCYGVTRGSIARTDSMRSAPTCAADRSACCTTSRTRWNSPTPIR